MVPLQGTGLSHSEIRGSKVICTYPQLIAAYHVLHRLREPRHPPCALTYFLSYRSRMVDIYFQLLTLLFLCTTCQRSCDLRLEDLQFTSEITNQKSRSEWRITDSNRWPPACKAGALASWANPPSYKWKTESGKSGEFPIFSFQFSVFNFEVVPGRVELPTSTLSV